MDKELIYGKTETKKVKRVIINILKMLGEISSSVCLTIGIAVLVVISLASWQNIPLYLQVSNGTPANFANFPLKWGIILFAVFIVAIVYLLYNALLAIKSLMKSAKHKSETL